MCLVRERRPGNITLLASHDVAPFQFACAHPAFYTVSIGLPPQVYLALLRQQVLGNAQAGWTLTLVVDGPATPPAPQPDNHQPAAGQPAAAEADTEAEAEAQAVQVVAPVEANEAAVAAERSEEGTAQQQGDSVAAAAAAAAADEPRPIIRWQRRMDWSAALRAAAQQPAIAQVAAQEAPVTSDAEAAASAAAQQMAETTAAADAAPAPFVPAVEQAVTAHKLTAAAPKPAAAARKARFPAALPVLSPAAASSKRLSDRSKSDEPLWRPTGPAPDAFSRPATDTVAFRVAKARNEAAQACRNAVRARRAALARSPRPAPAPGTVPKAVEAAAPPAAHPDAAVQEESAPAKAAPAAPAAAGPAAAEVETVLSSEGPGAPLHASVAQRAAGAAGRSVTPPQAPATPEVLSRRATRHDSGNSTASSQAVVSLAAAAGLAALAAVVGVGA